MSLTRPQKRAIYAEATMSERLRAPKCWLPDLIHSQMSSGNFARMARDAVAKAQSDRRQNDVTLYRNMLDQISDYWADTKQ